ncbi:MAG: helix-turn-helix domain-containing protein [Acidimicrobiales bacterium]
MTATDPRPMYGSLGPDPGWMTTTAAAKLLGATIRDLYRAIDRGLVPAYRIDGQIRLRRHEVDSLLSQRAGRPI